MRALNPEILNASFVEGVIRVAITFRERKGDPVEYATMNVRDALMLIAELSKAVRYAYNSEANETRTKKGK